MKHAHRDLIKEWLENMDQRIELCIGAGQSDWVGSSIGVVLHDTAGHQNFRFKAKDPFAELREAQASGKRVIHRLRDGTWADNKHGWTFRGNVEDYKIVPHDEERSSTLYGTPFGEVRIKLIKSGLTGKLSVELLE